MRNKPFKLCLIAIYILLLIASILDAHAYSTEDWVCEKAYEDNLVIAADEDNLPFITFYLGIEDNGYSFVDIIIRDDDLITTIHYTVKPNLLNNTLEYIDVKNSTGKASHDAWTRYSNMIKYYPHMIMIYNEAYYDGEWHNWGE